MSISVRPTAAAGTYEPPATGAQTVGPTRPSERVLTLDVLRGFAMFGVMLSNLNDWYNTKDAVTRVDRALAWSQEHLVESRFYSLLAFLFGLGFAMQLIRAERSGTDVRVTYYRRLAALLVIGVIHGTLIWSGDILTAYALVGCMLILFRDLSIRSLIIAAAAVDLVIGYVGTMILRAFHLRMVPFPSRTTAEWIYSHGSYGQIFHQRVYDYLDWLGRWPLRVYPAFLSLFILGLAVGRSGILSNLPERLPAIRKALVAALVCIVVGALVEAKIGDWWKPVTLFPESVHDAGFWSIRSTIVPIPDLMLTWGMAAVAACVLTLLTVRRPDALLVRWLAPVGRMPLTTYLTQSVVSTLLYYGYGLGLYGKVTFLGNLAITVGVFGLQIVVSQWWLRRYEFGPAEAVWRSLTYGRIVSVRRAG